MPAPRPARHPDLRGAPQEQPRRAIGATGDEARRLLDLEERRWTEVIRANNIKID